MLKKLPALKKALAAKKATVSKKTPKKVSVSKKKMTLRASTSKASSLNIEASVSDLPPLPKKTFTTKKNIEVYEDFNFKEYETSA